MHQILKSGIFRGIILRFKSKVMDSEKPLFGEEVSRSKSKINRFFIIGPQRSGTTLLDYLVNEHPEVVSVCEWEITSMIFFNQKERLKDLSFDSFVKNIEDHNIDPRKYLELVDSYLELRIGIKEFVEKAYDLCIHSDTVKAIGAKEAISHTHYEYNYVNKLYHIFGDDIRIIFISRDAKGIVNSFLKLGYFPPGKMAPSDKNLKKFVREYVKLINGTDKAVSRFSYKLYITYEELLRKPNDTLKSIFSFLGVSQHESIISRILSTPKRTRRINFDGIRSENVDSWKEMLSDYHIEFIDKYYRKKRKHYFHKASV